MDKNVRNQYIKSIIRLEEKISQCRRCKPLVNCTTKPSLGKGDLQAEVLLIFESKSALTDNTKWLIDLRNSIKEQLQIERIYHTFMVRCQPKACTICHVNNYSPNKKILNHDNICLLSRKLCDGIPIKPGNEEILNCLSFLLEEIAVFQPRHVILFGTRVSEFVLKTFGKFESSEIELPYKHGGTTFHTTVEEKSFCSEELQKLSRVMANI